MKPVICIHWDLWSPKVLSTAVADCMNWVACCRGGAVTVFLGPEATDLDKAGAAQLLSILSSMRIPIDDETPVSLSIGYYSTTLDKVPLLPFDNSRFPPDMKVLHKDLVQRVNHLRLSKDTPNYPHLRDRTLPAPPTANPMTRPRPPRATHNLFLPPWAYNA